MQNMEPLPGYGTPTRVRVKELTPLSQGGASLTLGFGMEPRCGSREYSLISGETGSNEADTYQIKLL